MTHISRQNIHKYSAWTPYTRQDRTLIRFHGSKENKQMNKLLSVSSITMILVLAACSPAAAPTQTAAPIVPLTFPAIAFYGNRTGDNEIYVMNEDGSGQVDLTNNPADDTHPVWSPDHTRIAFRSDRDGNQEIYVMNADGSHPRNLTQNPAWDDRPAWSPDGKQIAFTSDRSGTQNCPCLYLMNADGSGQTQLTISGQEITAYALAWSPDGTRIAVVDPSEDNKAIMLIKMDGSSADRIALKAGSVAWSPDGKRLAFGSGQASSTDNYEIYVMNVDGSNRINLTNSPATDDNPVWSPDGKQIAFNSDRDGNQEIYVMNADGSNPTNVSNSPGYDYFPAWSTK